MPVTVRERVFEALDNAVENGYALDEWAASEVADDLLTYCADLEGLDVDDVLPFIIEWHFEASVRRVQPNDKYRKAES
jgi:hypothetical protein